MKNIFLLPFLSLFLWGCEDMGNIDAVKNVIPNIDRTNTIGGILDNRDICEKVKWTQFIDSKNRPIVQYQCFLKLDLTFEKYNNEYKKKRIGSLRDSLEPWEETIEKYKFRIRKLQESKAYLISIHDKYKDFLIILDLGLFLLIMLSVIFGLSYLIIMSNPIYILLLTLRIKNLIH